MEIDGFIWIWCWIVFCGVRQLGRCGPVIWCCTLVSRVLWYGWGGVLEFVKCNFHIA